MKSAILAALTILVTQTAMAADLRIMQHDGASTWNPVRTEKIELLSTSNASGTTFVNVVTESVMCIVTVSDIASGASIVSAVSNNSTFECYTEPNRKQTAMGGRSVIETKRIAIIK